VAVQSKGFDEAPDVILRGLHRLIWAKKVAVDSANAYLGTVDQKWIGPHAVVPSSGDFNELLALGYMEQDKINVSYSILSLLVVTDREPTQYHDDGEHELGPVVAALSLGSPSTMRFRPKLKTGYFLPLRNENGKPRYKDVLEVPMKHGDMMVMAGTEIQKVFEVSLYIKQSKDDRANKTSTLSTPSECAVSRSRHATSTPSAWPTRLIGTTLL